MGVIYKIQNRESGKIYVGKTARTLDERMNEHTSKSRVTSNSYIDRAISKYGIDAFEVTVIEECDTEEKLNEREIFWIAFYNCKKPNGYNLTDGGEGVIGYKFSPELIEKRSKSRQGKKISEKARKALSNAKKGKKLSDEVRARMSNSNKSKCPVKCVETGEIFESMTAAAKSIGVSFSGIKNVLAGNNHTAGGYHWEDAKVDVKPSIQKNSRPVQCVETGEIFESISADAKWVNLSRENIKCAIRKNTRAGGYHWVDAD